mmetsp:Transcript_45140/g.143809  ORF Transcript_45140/g.143809 Transcript_45140/m.143809 type:complete len:243 (-) Transcript_45140:171-899(-)
MVGLNLQELRRALRQRDAKGVHDDAQEQQRPDARLQRGEDRQDQDPEVPEEAKNADDPDKAEDTNRTADAYDGQVLHVVLGGLSPPEPDAHLEQRAAYHDDVQDVPSVLLPIEERPALGRQAQQELHQKKTGVDIRDHVKDEGAVPIEGPPRCHDLDLHTNEQSIRNDQHRTSAVEVRALHQPAQLEVRPPPAGQRRLLDAVHLRQARDAVVEELRPRATPPQLLLQAEFVAHARGRAIRED